MPLSRRYIWTGNDDYARLGTVFQTEKWLLLRKFMLICSVGIMAYNEEGNISRLLEALIGQVSDNFSISEIIIVASGCTDHTEEIVAALAKDDPRIRLIHQEKREGKASAINLWLKNATGQILIMESADTVPEKDCLEKLVAPFHDQTIGMTGAHPVPLNDPHSLMGFAAALLWRLHHAIALETPKLGELVAFRNVVKSIPPESAVDEASLEAEIVRQGYYIAYAPEAIVHNKGPETMSDFLRQRRRITAGHLWLRDNYGYQVSTMSALKIWPLLLRNIHWNSRETIYAPIVIILEAYGRFLGWYDYRIKKTNPTVWQIAKTTKDLAEK